MKEPRRWMDDEGAPEELRNLLGRAGPPIPMSAESRARGRRAVRRMAVLPVGLAAWIGAKGAVAAMGTFAAASATTFFVIESRKATEVPSVAAPAAEGTRRAARPAESRRLSNDLENGEEEALDEGPLTPDSPASEARKEEAAAARGSTGGVSPTASADRGDLLAESHLLEVARKDLSSDPSSALVRCAEHARRYPRGQLASERAIIEIDALRRLGRSAEARARAEAILRKHPDGLYADRVRKLMGSIEP